MLVAPNRRMTCAVNQCGEWWSKDALALEWCVVETAEPYRLFGAVARELPCPECARSMIVSLRAKVEFAHCDAHGLWLDRSERAAFDALGGWSRMLAVSDRRSTR
jgi:hypothetical protein